MLRYAADENFNNDIVWGLLRRNVGLVIDDLLLLAEASSDNEWQGQILYLPLRY